MNNNILTLTDSYKNSHWSCYPPNTQKVFSYFESRGGEYDEVVFFGLQMLLERLEGIVITQDKINVAEALVNAHMGPGVFNRKGWDRLLEVHKGKLPIIIKAIPEGTPVPVGNALMTVENTDPEFYWLTNFLETYLSQVWYPCTVATISREIKKIINHYLETTGDNNGLDFKLHDFGFRGVSSVESAGIGGCAHLVNFMGTDTIAALEYARYFYNERLAGFSIPAAEHSTITSWGKDNELNAFENMLDKYPTGLVAVVSDSFNIYKACEEMWGDKLKEKILNRDGVLIIRPDSGEPVEVITKIIEILGNKFGYTTNEKGYKLLDPHIRIIQGDGVDADSIAEILIKLKRNGWSADNIAFGMGGALLQKLNRDTHKFAFKCSSVTIDGKVADVFKQPIDAPFKKSKAGRLKTVIMALPEGDEWRTVAEDEQPHTHMKDMLETVFMNGKIVKKYTFDEVRKNARIK